MIEQNRYKELELMAKMLGEADGTKLYGAQLMLRALHENWTDKGFSQGDIQTYIKNLINTF
jgi:hypothetical protein